jgi:hypothetical protein
MKPSIIVPFDNCYDLLYQIIPPPSLSNEAKDQPPCMNPSLLATFLLTPPPRHPITTHHWQYSLSTSSSTDPPNPSIRHILAPRSPCDLPHPAVLALLRVSCKLVLRHGTLGAGAGTCVGLFFCGFAKLGSMQLASKFQGSVLARQGRGNV